MKTKIISAVLAAAFVLTAGISAFAAGGSMDNFVPENTYTGGFTDLPQDEWYVENIITSYEYGFMVGNDDGTFTPESYLTIAEAVVMADRVRQIYYTGSSTLEAADGVRWYEPFVEYAVENGIIENGDFAEYDIPATRAQMAYILARALPESELEEINEVTALPDVGGQDEYAHEIFSLYKAGVLIGNDKFGTFNPDTNIPRYEAAAIISRLAVPALRLTFVRYETHKIGPDDAYVEFDLPARYAENSSDGSINFEDPLTHTIVSSMASVNSIYNGLTITAVFSQDDIISLYEDSLSNGTISVTEISAQRASFGDTPAYLLKVTLDYEDIVIHGYIYTFIENSVLFEVSFISDSDDEFLKGLVSSTRVLGSYSSAIL